MWARCRFILPPRGLALPSRFLNYVDTIRIGALNAMGIAAAAAETVVGARIELDQKRVNKPLKEGATGALIRLGGLLSGPLPLALRLLSLGASRPNSRKLRRAAAASTIAGSMITRQAWIKVGKVSAQDSKVALNLPEKADTARRHMTRGVAHVWQVRSAPHPVGSCAESIVASRSRLC